MSSFLAKRVQSKFGFGKPVGNNSSLGKRSSTSISQPLYDDYKEKSQSFPKPLKRQKISTTKVS